MSDENHPQGEVPPDPLDAAYAQAEARLEDPAARAARRARVLAAVARDAAPPLAAAVGPRRSARPRPRSWRAGGWLVAACVAALSLFVAIQNYAPPVRAPQVAAPAKPPPPPTAGPQTAAAPAPATPRPHREAGIAPTPPSGHSAPNLARNSLAAPAPQPPQAVPAAPPSAPPPPPPRFAAESTQNAPSAGVPAEAAGGASSQAREAMRAAASPPLSLAAPPPQTDAGAALRAAAAAGRTAEVKALLEQGVPVDAAGADGDTPLMKSIAADQRAVAALLRRHGASLDRRNHAGESARDMAAARGDPALDAALGIELQP